MRSTIYLAALVMGVGLLMLPRDARAQGFSVNFEEYDYGEVELDTPATQIFEITAEEDIEILTIFINDDSADVFDITTELPGFPYSMRPGDSLAFEVTFTPDDENFFDGSFEVVSDVDPENRIFVSISGTGVESAPPPCVEVADILKLFDDAVASGDLDGDGPGKSAGGRLKALRNMIEASGDLIDQGETEQAWNQLLSAYDRCDGESQPPDFVAGQAAALLNEMIGELLFSMCL